MQAEEHLSAADELVTALAAGVVPFTFQIQSEPASTRFQVGVWPEDPALLPTHAKVLGAAVKGAYLGVLAEEIEATAPRAWPCAGLVIGAPKLAPAGHRHAVDQRDGTNASDRLVRALTGLAWSLLVLAQPLEVDHIVDLRNRLINDVRAAAAAEAALDVASPLGLYYQDVLKQRIETLTNGLSRGAWRVAVYLQGDDVSYPALASVWKAVHSGSDASAEPVRVFDGAPANQWAAQWAMADDEDIEGPGFYRHPFAAQTVMSSPQLATLVDLPRRELPGFSVWLQAEFDVVPKTVATDSGLSVGRIIHEQTTSETEFMVDLQSLTRHAFVAGATGSGKTNTIFHLLLQAAGRGVPFMVLEPAKTEYRDLMDEKALGGNVTVFSAGDETVAPLRLNPFDVPPGVPVSTHIDLLRAAFGASFGMWTPLPQVLERCLHEIYADYGWDLRTNRNARLDDPQAYEPDAYPTLGDLVAKAEDVVPTLGYEDRVEGDIRAALLTRLEALRIGGKGALFDTRRSLSAELLFDAPVVIELEPLGDDDDKALLMALLLIRLAEWRRAHGEREGLQHLLVIEEAHRLLAPAGPRMSEEVADPRGEAVRTFSNLLSEVRAYGQGVIVADQVPTRLLPDVIKNTNLKIAHRLVAADDQEILARTMALNDDQSRALAILAPGEGALFSDGDDSALRVRVPWAKSDLKRVPTSAVADAASERRKGLAAELFNAEPFCTETCNSVEVCASARAIVSDPGFYDVFARVALSLIEEAGALDRLWEDIIVAVRARQPVAADEAEMITSVCAHAAVRYARRRGAQARWPYAATVVLSTLLREALLERAENPDAVLGPTDAREAFRDAFRELSARTFPPFVACDTVCSQEPPVCLYRHAAADLLASQRFAAAWREAEHSDAQNEKGRPEAWEVAQNAGYQLIEFSETDIPEEARSAVEDGARRASLCFAQQIVSADVSKAPRTARRAIGALLEESGLVSDVAE